MNGESAYDRLRDYRDTHPDDRMSKDIAILLREVGASELFGGSFTTAHRRMVDGIREGERWFNRAQVSEDLVATFNLGVNEPLWRRISNQRRELVKLHWWVDTYRKWYREARDELEALKRER